MCGRALGSKARLYVTLLDQPARSLAVARSVSSPRSPHSPGPTKKGIIKPVLVVSYVCTSHVGDHEQEKENAD
jgi:hypothetical protein